MLSATRYDTEVSYWGDWWETKWLMKAKHPEAILWQQVKEQVNFSQMCEVKANLP